MADDLYFYAILNDCTALTLRSRNAHHSRLPGEHFFFWFANQSNDKLCGFFFRKIQKWAIAIIPYDVI